MIALLAAVRFSASCGEAEIIGKDTERIRRENGRSSIARVVASFASGRSICEKRCRKITCINIQNNRRE